MKRGPLAGVRQNSRNYWSVFYPNGIALKMAINHRKNSYFYRSLRGAEVGDIFMSLIRTAELNGENAFDYLNELQRNAALVRENPGDWLPWNYRETLARMKTQPETQLARVA